MSNDPIPNDHPLREHLRYNTFMDSFKAIKMHYLTFEPYRLSIGESLDQQCGCDPAKVLLNAAELKFIAKAKEIMHYRGELPDIYI